MNYQTQILKGNSSYDTILHKIQTIQVLGRCQGEWEIREKRLGLSALCGRGIQPLGSV